MIYFKYYSFYSIFASNNFSKKTYIKLSDFFVTCVKLKSGNHGKQSYFNRKCRR